MTGMFVCVEGIDGAGKTTAVRAAGQLLHDRGHSVYVLDKHRLQFESPYVHRQIGRLRDLIWGNPGDDPYLDLGDLFWVHLQAAWYSAVTHLLVRPLLANGRIVITDTWVHKFLAKLALRPAVDLDRVRTAFADLPRPDLTVRFVLKPEVAAQRKAVFGRSEAGNSEHTTDLSASAFVAYQQRLSEVLDGFSSEGGWVSIDVGDLDVAATAAVLAEQIVSRLPRAAGATG